MTKSSFSKNCKSPERSIGIFDSGMGGLSVLRHVHALLPRENLIYFADTARLPYGEKSMRTLLNYCVENVEFLMRQKIKVLIIACHTACVAALKQLRKRFSIPIVAITEQALDEVVRLTTHQKIAIAATKRTISSCFYQNLIHKHLPQAEIHAIACPLLVPLIEEGYTDHPLTSAILEEYMSPIKHQPLDALLLGCTHYPLLLRLWKKWRNDLCFIDPAAACAEKTRQLLEQHELLNPQTKPAQCLFFVSERLRKRTGNIFR